LQALELSRPKACCHCECKELKKVLIFVFTEGQKFVPFRKGPIGRRLLLPPDPGDAGTWIKIHVLLGYRELKNLTRRGNDVSNRLRRLSFAVLPKIRLKFDHVLRANIRECNDLCVNEIMIS